MPPTREISFIVAVPISKPGYATFDVDGTIAYAYANFDDTLWALNGQANTWTQLLAPPGSRIISSMSSQGTIDPDKKSADSQGANLLAICTDDTYWCLNNDTVWTEIPAIPTA